MLIQAAQLPLLSRMVSGLTSSSLSLHTPTGYVSPAVDDGEALIMDHGENHLATQSCMSVEQSSEVSSGVHQVPQLAYGKVSIHLAWTLMLSGWFECSVFSAAALKAFCVTHSFKSGFVRKPLHRSCLAMHLGRESLVVAWEGFVNSEPTEILCFIKAVFCLLNTGRISGSDLASKCHGRAEALCSLF